MNTEMLRKEQAPFYVYEKSVIKSQIELVKDTLPQFDCLYSIKCNPYQPVVDFIAANGIGSDAASWREVEISAEAGMKAEDIYFSTPGKTREDIAKSIGTCVLIADSFHELELLDELAKEKGLQVKAGLRINPDFTMAGGAGVSTKFGVDEEILLASKDYLQSLKNVALVGIHIHAKSQELDADRLAAYYKNVFELALRCQDTLGITLEFVNFGGG